MSVGEFQADFPPQLHEGHPMPLSAFLKSAAGTSPFCNQKADILSREHPDRRKTLQAAWNDTVRLSAVGANYQQPESPVHM